MKVKYCPSCRKRLIHYFSIPIFSSDNNEIKDHYNIYYCPNIRCHIKKVIYDDDGIILNIYYYKNITTKYKKLLFSINHNMPYYKPNSRKKMKEKREKLKKLLNI